MSPDGLWNLLPVVYRQRDLEIGGPLRGLLQVVAEQVDTVGEAIDRLYDNWFIETCEPWAVPYLAELVGYQPMQGARRLVQHVRNANDPLEAVLYPRQDVAETMRYRRRKGTLQVLQAVAYDASGWPARALEYDRLVVGQRTLEHRRSGSGRSIDLRRVDSLEDVGGPFDPWAHTLEVRRPDSHRRPGRYNLPSLVVHLARRLSLPVTRAPAHRIEGGGGHRFTFSSLGNDEPLHLRARPEAIREAEAREADLPVPLRRSLLDRMLGTRAGEDGWRPIDAIYGPAASVAIWAPGWGDGEGGYVEPSKIIAADLSDWSGRPRPGLVAVDPELGRLAFRPGEAPEQVIVSYRYGRAAEIGGGEYLRPMEPVPAPSPAGAPVPRFRIAFKQEGAYASLAEALAAWRAANPPLAFIEFGDSRLYEEGGPQIELSSGQQLVIRAAPGCRPLIRLRAAGQAGAGPLRICGQGGGELTLEGLLILGHGVRLDPGLQRLRLRHCTLVPGWGERRENEGAPQARPSMAVHEADTRIEIANSILGPIHVTIEAGRHEALPLELSDSIVDSGAEDGDLLQFHGGLAAYVALRLLRVTMLGRLAVHRIDHAENTIVTGRILVARRQAGCVRYCYVAPGSRTPARYRCQPDASLHGLDEPARRAAELRIRPRFDSLRYGAPDYARLARHGPPEIRRGADDESEIGAYHDLYEPQREAGLRSRLAEFVPTQYDLGISFID